jgi:hypothetical protein
VGDDIRALDLDMEMPNADREAKQHYALAVDRYTQAEEALDAARRPEDLRRVSQTLEEGWWAMEAARAEMEGRPPPVRRPPCFFDPRHGPSVTDVEWAPSGGQVRAVPVCAADAVRIQERQEPDARQVPVNGRLVPYCQAGPMFAPWAGGFFGGGLLPGFFAGTLVGEALGSFGATDPGYASGYIPDSVGGGDFGGAGDVSGGADFGGSDFGGGDFGGDDFGGGGDF